MKVEIWSDFVCPFCYIGKRRYEEALAGLPFAGSVQTIFRSFELDPNAPVDPGYDVHDMLARKYGMSRERAREMNAGVAAQAAQVGLTYHYDDWKVTNTFDAHRLAHYAAAHGKAAEMTERLLYAHFTEARHLGDRETLAALAADAGLDRDDAAAALARGDYADAVRADEREAAALGIRGVPFFVIDRKYGISGAQPAEAFAEALQRAWNERGPGLEVLGGTGAGEAAGCGDGACAVPDAAAEAAKER